MIDQSLTAVPFSRKLRWQFLLVLLPISMFARQTQLQQDPYQQYFNARQWFQQENYRLAYPVFKEAQSLAAVNSRNGNELQRSEIEFYLVACELMQSNIQAAEHAQYYLAQNNSESFKGQLAYYLGLYYFRQQQFSEAIAAFEQSTPANLNNAQVAELQFSQGYSYFSQKKYAQAKPLLMSSKSTAGSKFYTDGNYYYGLICFNEKRYREALTAFEAAKANPKYQTLAPYYLASINYTLGQKDKGLDLAERALKQNNPGFKAELSQLLGHGYFEKGNYEKALLFLEKYVASAEKVKREDLYELGFCYYQQNRFPEAIEQFRPLSGGMDTLSQSAMYMLGDAYLKTRQKANARNAFLFCSTNSSNAATREVSAFLYGKLSYELGFDNEALPALQNFISTNAKSRYAEDAKDLLVNVLSNTSNYKEALELYEGLPNKSENTRKQYAKILFNRAQELLNDGMKIPAEALLDKAIVAPFNAGIKPLALFWKAELAYERDQFPTAEGYYRRFLEAPVTNADISADNARYGLAYCLLHQNKYESAQKEFAAISNARLGSTQQQQDVTARNADCYFMLKSYNSAKALYAKIVAANGTGADYASFQLGMIAGAQNKTAEKISGMKTIEVLYPNSIMIQPANMEIANTYLADEKFKEAIPFLNNIITNKQNSSLKPEAYLKSGIAYYNADNNAEALKQFKILLKQYPQAPESEDAIDNIRSIFVEEGNPAEFVAFMAQIGRNLDVAQADSLIYTAAELQLSEGKKEAAVVSLKQYLQQFPAGRYAIPANYNLAELASARQDFANAALYYAAVAEKAPNKYAEKAVLSAARIYYFELKDLPKAAVFFQQLKDMAGSQDNRLEGMRGLLRCQFYGKQFAMAGDNARDLLQQSGAGNDDKTFANLVLGKNAQQKASYSEAINYYKTVISLNKAEYGAEARFETSACLFSLNKLAEAEKAAFEVIKKSGSYELWVTKAYILLGDIYFSQKDYFNAKATFKSVSENTAIAELREEAAMKLVKVEAEEQARLGIGG